MIGAIGIGFLVAMFVSFAVAANGPALVLGRVNDVWPRLRRGAPASNALLALLTLGVWFVLAGHLGSSSGALRGGTRMGLLASPVGGAAER